MTQTFKLIVRSVPGDAVPAVTRLRTLLKHLLREHRFQCVEVTGVTEAFSNLNSTRKEISNGERGRLQKTDDATTTTADLSTIDRGNPSGLSPNVVRE